MKNRKKQIFLNKYKKYEKYEKKQPSKNTYEKKYENCQHSKNKYEKQLKFGNPPKTSRNRIGKTKTVKTNLWRVLWKIPLVLTGSGVA